MHTMNPSLVEVKITGSLLGGIISTIIESI